jgi:hypothetical protein
VLRRWSAGFDSASRAKPALGLMSSTLHLSAPGRRTSRSEPVMSRTEGSAVSHGGRINAADIAEAVTGAPFTYTTGQHRSSLTTGAPPTPRKGANRPEKGEWTIKGGFGLSRRPPTVPPTTSRGSQVPMAMSPAVNAEGRSRDGTPPGSPDSRDAAYPRALLERDLRRGCIRCIPRIGAPVSEARVVVGPRQASGPRGAPWETAQTVCPTCSHPGGHPPEPGTGALLPTDRYVVRRADRRRVSATSTGARIQPARQSGPLARGSLQARRGELSGAPPTDGAASASDIDPL